jgi:hypothetical protein
MMTWHIDTNTPRLDLYDSQERMKTVYFVVIAHITVLSDISLANPSICTHSSAGLECAYRPKQSVISTVTALSKTHMMPRNALRQSKLTKSSHILPYTDFPHRSRYVHCRSRILTCIHITIESDLQHQNDPPRAMWCLGMRWRSQIGRLAHLLCSQHHTYAPSQKAGENTHAHD